MKLYEYEVVDGPNLVMTLTEGRTLQREIDVIIIHHPIEAARRLTWVVREWKGEAR